MAKLKEKEYLFHFPVFGYTVEVVITDDILESRKKRSHLYGFYDESVGKAYALHSSNLKIAQATMFFTADASINCIVHESVHAIDKMFEYIGADVIDTEVRAYHTDYLVGKIVPLFKKK